MIYFYLIFFFCKIPICLLRVRINTFKKHTFFTISGLNTLNYICFIYNPKQQLFTGTCGWTQLLLITEYHENGSLFDYLQTHSLNIDLLLSMSLGISKGISHLHTEIFGVSKPININYQETKMHLLIPKAKIT